ncbi:hypothetical protein D0T53_01535 [Dysgonomonas sp. 216]|uniref:capsule assembly Wzi family protein n=1 Tax=Dysgonomonas sp. 216 TaxID=2302934 RepID=UPI0013D10626|nr:capsule assembly Wzi family protein [Dysgonomonas sp. 216]NDW17597.1 hypothetical protein [Dysgonomonas sp. 216]
MFKYKNIFCFLFGCLAVLSAKAEGNDTITISTVDETVSVSGIGYSINSLIKVKATSAGVFSDGDYSPFWLTNNNHGIASDKSNNQYVRGEVYYATKLLKSKDLSITVGLDMIAARNLQSDIYVQQAFADLNYKVLGLSVGMKERRDHYKNMLLSTGGMALSQNARPIPQVELGFPKYVTVPYTNNLLHVLGGVSYGKFLDDDFKKRYAGDGTYASDVLYHRKYIFATLDKRRAFNFTLGMEMNTQWGGHFYQKGEYKFSSPAKLSDMFKVFVPMKGGGDSNPTDESNIQGNVFGSWHFIGNYKQENYSIKAYYEHFFEDHSGLFFKNMPDGLYGIELNLHKFAPVSTILFEYIHTKDQSSPFLWDEYNDDYRVPIQVSGNDNYYNQCDYISLSNYGMVLGNPLLTSPIYNNGRTLQVLNNRISAFHGAIAGKITSNLSYRAMVTYSRSWGTYILPARSIRNQFSSMMELSYSDWRLWGGGWLFSGALAYDNSSTMVGDNLGFRLKVSKSFLLR